MPLVDANMRELSCTGFMSNRGRQNVASYLILDLGVDWRRGADWFEHQLVDHDVSSNWGNWVAAAGLTGARPACACVCVLLQRNAYSCEAQLERLVYCDSEQCVRVGVFKRCARKCRRACKQVQHLQAEQGLRQGGRLLAHLAARARRRANPIHPRPVQHAQERAV